MAVTWQQKTLQGMAGAPYPRKMDNQNKAGHDDPADINPLLMAGHHCRRVVLLSSPNGLRFR